MKSNSVSIPKEAWAVLTLLLKGIKKVEELAHLREAQIDKTQENQGSERENW